MSALRYIPILPLALATGLAVVVAAALFAYLVRHSGLRRGVVVTSRVLFGGVVLAVLAVTLTGGASSGAGINLVPGAGIAIQLNNANTSLGVVNIVGNVAMFVPVGALAVVALPSGWLRATLTGVSLSVAVEAMQLALGRSADIDDVILNTVGAALGAVVAVVLAYCITRARPAQMPA